jgi:two-component system LytT family sensor kinase
MDYFRRTPVPYRTILITAGVLATLFLFQSYMHHFVYRDLKELGEFNWWREAPVPYLNFLFWALLCPLVYRIFLRWPFSTRPLYPTIAIHIGLGVLIASIHEVTTATIYYTILQSIGEFDFNDPFYHAWAIQSLAPGIFGRLMEYGVLMGVLAGLENARQRRMEHEQLIRVQSELQTTQLNALRKQLQPHFLFNTLNTVSALMEENIGAARTVLSRLGQLLRITLDKTQYDTVSLEREVEYIGNYLGIESERFRDRLQVTYSIPDELKHIQVPSMLLQPLVENAIKHGPYATEEPVVIAIRARSTQEQLILEVQDNGKGCPDTEHALLNGGIGLRNVRDRMELMYNGHATFSVNSPNGKGFLVELSLPLVYRKP